MKKTMRIAQSQKELESWAKSHYLYDKTTGAITRKISVVGHAKGEVAGCLYPNGYRFMGVLGKIKPESNVAWFLHYGVWPKLFIDHKNQIPSDNRICNLREATTSENATNRGVQKNNKCGYKGVILHKSTGKFQARIAKNQKVIYLGLFTTAKDAAKAYQQAAKEYHGEFAKY